MVSRQVRRAEERRNPYWSKQPRRVWDFDWSKYRTKNNDPEYRK